MSAECGRPARRDGAHDAAFDAPENKGKGVLKVEGRMVELLHAEEARRLVALADAIAEAEGGATR